MTSHAIRHVRVTPIAFRDPPLLNAAGIHEPWALRSIIEIETDSGLVGINESYGDLPMLEALAKAAPALTGLSPWALNEMDTRVAALVSPKQMSASEFLGKQVSLATGTHVSKTVAKVISAFEVAMMDLQGQLANAPVVDLLRGAQCVDGNPWVITGTLPGKPLSDLAYPGIDDRQRAGIPRGSGFKNRFYPFIALL